MSLFFNCLASILSSGTLYKLSIRITNGNHMKYEQKKNLQLTVLLILITVLSACSQSKQSRSISPYFDGVIKLNNNTVENVKIMLSVIPDDKQCNKAKLFATTNSQGLFSLPAATQTYTFTPFANYQFDEWTVCAYYNNVLYTLHNNNRYASGNVTGSVFLNCDLSNSKKLCTITH